MIDPRDHIGLMMNHIKKYADYCTAMGDHTITDDLIGIGYEVLADACRTFDEKKGYKPSTHIMTALRWQVHRRHRIMRGHVEMSIPNGKTCPCGKPSRNRVFANRPTNIEAANTKYYHAEFDRVDRNNDAKEIYSTLANSLSNREKMIVSMVAAGKNNREIADEFGIDRERVRQIRKRITAKCSEAAVRNHIDHPLVHVA